MLNNEIEVKIESYFLIAILWQFHPTTEKPEIEGEALNGILGNRFPYKGWIVCGPETPNFYENSNCQHKTCQTLLASPNWKDHLRKLIDN